MHAGMQPTVSDDTGTNLLTMVPLCNLPSKQIDKETRRLQCLRATLYEPSRRTTNAVRSSVKLLRDSLAQRNSYQDNRKTP